MTTSELQKWLPAVGDWVEETKPPRARGPGCRTGVVVGKVGQKLEVLVVSVYHLSLAQPQLKTYETIVLLGKKLRPFRGTKTASASDLDLLFSELLRSQETGPEEQEVLTSGDEQENAVMQDSYILHHVGANANDSLTTEWKNEDKLEEMQSPDMITNVILSNDLKVQELPGSKVGQENTMGQDSDVLTDPLIHGDAHINDTFSNEERYNAENAPSNDAFATVAKLSNDLKLQTSQNVNFSVDAGLCDLTPERRSKRTLESQDRLSSPPRVRRKQSSALTQEFCVRCSVQVQWMQGSRARLISTDDGKGRTSRTGVDVRLFGCDGEAEMTTRGLLNNITCNRSNVVRIHDKFQTEGRATLVTQVATGEEGASRLVYVFLSKMHPSQLATLLQRLRT